MLKRLWFQTHWLLGISAGVVLAVMGVTGATLSFENELLRVLNPGVVTVPTEQHPLLTPPQLLQRIAAEHPERHVGTISVSNVAGRAARVGFVPPTRAGAAAGATARPRMEVFLVHPYSGALLGHEEALRGHATLHLMEDLHRRLATGDTGKALTGASTLILLVLAGTGLYLRWPRRWKDLHVWFAVRWRLRSGAFLKSLHEVVGTWLLLPTLIVALTGLWWSYDWYRNGLLQLTGSAPPQRMAPRVPDRASASLNELALGWAAFVRATASTGYSSASFNLPATGDPLVLNYLDAFPAHERANNRITLDLASGAVQQHERYEDKSAGAKLSGSMFVLHKGSYFGLGGTLVMMLASLSMPLFAVTGWMLYLKRRKVARAQKARTVPVETAQA